MVKESFTQWITREVEQRGWSYSELARRAGVSTAQVSLVLSGHSNPGEKFCRGVARAFGVDPGQVFRRAGLLPPATEDTEMKETMLYYWDKLTSNERYTVLTQLRALAETRSQYTINQEAACG